MSTWDRATDIHKLRSSVTREGVRKYGSINAYRVSITGATVGLDGQQEVATPHAIPATEAPSKPSQTRASEPRRVEVAHSGVRVLPMAVPSVWELLSTVGALRQVSLNAGGPKGFRLTVKLYNHRGEAVYRYGFLSAPEEAASVIAIWVREGYWTPDKF